MNIKEMTPVKVAIYRCGTSKAIFIHKNDLPKDKETRDKVILSIFGSPDPRQIDGLGGAEVLTSKLGIISPPSVPEADVDFTFGQVDIETPFISYSGLCGNVASGVASFAIEEGLVNAQEPYTTVRIYSTNTDQYYTTVVPISGNSPKVLGDYVVPGVPGSGAKLSIDMSRTVGSFGKGLLPTGNPLDAFDVPGFGKLEGSLVDVVNPCLFIRADALGLKGTEVKKTDFAAGQLELLERIRKVVFETIGKPYAEKDAVPFLAFVSEPTDYTNHLTGETIYGKDMDFVSRVFFLGGIHQTYPGSISCCTGACAVIPGTVLHKIRGEKDDSRVIIGHPGGLIDVEAVCETDEKGKPVIKKAAYARTARRIMDGYCYVPSSLF